MTGLKPYPEYKASGVDWLGDIPAHWEMVKLKNGFDMQKRPAIKSAGIVTAFRDGQVTLRSNRRIDGYTEGDKQIGYQTIHPGDLVIHAMDAFAGAIGVSDSLGKSTPVYSACIPKSGFNAHFYARALRHIALTGYISSLAKGVRERSTDFRWADAKELSIPKPPLEEQNSIVSFLNRETAQIDNLIGKQQQLIDLLAEKRQAIITRAVTKGLDPTARTKPSDIPWLGNVPAHWEVAPLKYLLQEPLKYGANESAEFDDPTWPRYLRITDFELDGALKTHTFRSLPPQIAAAYLVEPGDVLFARSGATVGKTFIVPEDSPRSCFAGYLIKASCDRNKLLPSFFSAYTKSSVFAEWKDASLTVATIQNIGADKLAGLAVPVPPLIEQLEVIGKLQSRLSELDVLMGKAKDSVVLLLERRSALISAAVTGKINVSNEGVAA